MSRFASATPAARAGIVAAAAVLLLGLWAVLAMVATMIGLGRFASDLDFVRVPGWLWANRAHPQVQLWTKISGLGSAAFILVLGLTAVLRVRRPLHGAARWANEGEIRREGMRAKHGIILGRKGAGYLVFGGAEHVMLYAPTRTGKGVGVVIPNLLNWADSVVVLDIKKENWEATAGFRAKHCQNVVMFDPLDPEGRTARYNPLAYIDRSNPVEALDELQKLATMLFPAPEKGDPFWSEASRTGFVGVGAYVAQTPDLPFTIGEIYRQLTSGNPKTRFPALMEARSKGTGALSAGCVNALNDFCSASDNTFAGIKQTITSRMNLWLNPRVDAATSASDFDLRELRSKRTSVYLGVTPDNMARVAPLYNLFFQQLVDLNTRELPAAGRHAVQVLVLLDEFARIGHASVIAKGFSYVAGYGLRLLPVIQSPSQLRAEYGPDVAEEIMTNCGVEVVFTPKELKVAQDLSERLGYYTYEARSKSRPTFVGGGKRTTTESDQRRALMLPQELMQMSKDALIVLRGGIAPIQASKIYFFKSRDFTRRICAPPVISALPAIAALPSEQSNASRLETMAADLAALTRSVGEIHARIITRPLTVSEAAGETDLDLDSLTLDVDVLDADELPDGTSEEQSEHWINQYINSSLLLEATDR
ncbi:type IV secretory system conjugative DNA transfer family protein [Phenylobacterium sp. LjRoot225]|uniref:type IV secretory system conjugative DNA transfer family protein n=1 Tax=Phenylobacterium sp. LjRoot225 TaxID=3342285 RepID=UPI003ECC37FF